MKRLNKEYKLDSSSSVILETDYDKVIADVETEMRKNIRNGIVDGVNFANKFILDFDISTDGLYPNRKKFLSFDFYLRQNERNKKKLADLKEFLDSKVRYISNEMVYMFKENGFTVEKQK